MFKRSIDIIIKDFFVLLHAIYGEEHVGISRAPPKIAELIKQREKKKRKWIITFEKLR